MILVTGCAGFIGFHLCQHLLGNGVQVLGVDNLNNYYSPKLKEARLTILQQSKNFTFQKLDICNQPELNKLKASKIELIVHLAAQPGVRYSLENPHAYTKNNIDGHLNILEFARQLPGLKKLVYASSSSIYGNNEKVPFAVDDITDNPASVYAATKKACELLSQTYFNLYKIPMVGLRFFTVYGPWGRPDMSPYKFTEAIIQGRIIDVYNFGKMQRDFTYIDDIISGINATLHLKHKDHRIYNLGNHKPVELMYFIQTLEKALGKTAQINMLPMQPGEVLTTYADIDKSFNDLNFKPKTSIEEGLPKFVEWFKEYNKN
jgi:UDP-glucuronate 4-epimerase